MSTATIQGVIDGGYKIIAHCAGNHSAYLDLEAIRARFGPEFSAMSDNLTPRLRCRKCGRMAQGILIEPDSTPFAMRRAGQGG